MTDYDRQGTSLTYDSEKGSDVVQHVSPVVGNDVQRYHFDKADLDRVQRRLKQRHIQMIAIAGTIGTGLFLGSGRAIAQAGPLGALIAYALVGTVAFSSLCSVGELACYAPISGTFPHFAARFVDPALGFAVGWNYAYASSIGASVEIVASGILIGYWDTNLDHQPAYIAAFCVVVVLINIFGVRWFGESEFFFSCIKIMLITGLIIAGLVIDLGGGPDGDRRGFRYWKDPGAIARAGLASGLHTDRFLAMLSVLVQAAFSFQGMELVAIAASETENPRRNIAKAVRRVFYRIVVFYLLGVLITGMLVPYNDPSLLRSTGTAAQSPYVIAMRRAGIKALPSVINAAVFTSALSAANTCLFCASRILYGLSIRGQAPKYLSKCTSSGLPIYAILTTSLFVPLSFLSVSSGSSKVFTWLTNLTTVSGFINWWTINFTFICFYRGCKAQGINRKEFIYYNSLQPYLSYWAIFWTTLFILTSGYAVFFKFNASDFFTYYINIPMFTGLFCFWKIYKRTKAWKSHEIDFVTGIPSIEETEGPEEKPTTFLGKVSAAIF